jgi:hypothetical protein
MARELVTALADAARVRYRVDIDVVAQVVTAFVDGIELAWLVDGDDERALRGFLALGDLLTVYIEPLEPGAATTPGEDPSTASV